MNGAAGDARLLDDEALRGWPLPSPEHGGDKEARGRVLVIGGSREMPGAASLAATAAFRAGAGKVTVATGASIAPLVATVLPEARVIGLPETDENGLWPSELDAIAEMAQRADALLVGPGMQDEPSVCAFVAALLPRLGRGTPVLLDAAAMGIARTAPGVLRAAGALLTPHAGEMARLLGRDKEAVAASPVDTVLEAARQWQAVVALKGAVTHIATPDGTLWRHERGNVGLAISGSGDTLAGLVAGLLARGADPVQALAWGVALHARAGERLADRMGPIGYLPRELAAEVPALMHALGEAGAGARGGRNTSASS
ncbi:NAD(P)H-hydrate dehydratase [Caldimonas tepidiphila]|uniref:NAD(P)H-hydrate dehydratase n=1 Tax=Caldimonas tepidiphila TaxID=2315841 RepID=UPI000E5BDAFD|nr:NAD(P)H-hydrate dehydratase [Caldimonas tepidiphila]